MLALALRLPSPITTTRQTYADPATAPSRGFPFGTVRDWRLHTALPSYSFHEEVRRCSLGLIKGQAAGPGGCMSSLAEPHVCTTRAAATAALVARGQRSRICVPQVWPSDTSTREHVVSAVVRRLVYCTERAVDGDRPRVSCTRRGLTLAIFHPATLPAPEPSHHVILAS